jgi:hypothetical protein
MDARMKSAWRNSTFGAVSPGGRPGVSSCKALSMSAVSFTVSPEGCFCTLTITAGAPL